MKQIIPFNKEIEFNTRVHEVTSISLEHSLQMKEKNLISGEFVINGEYKINEISVNKEAFNFNLPFSIELDSKYNTENVKIDIDDFYYELVRGNILKINIDVLIDGLEVLEVLEEKEDNVNNLNFEDETEEEYVRDEVMDLFKEVEPKVVPVEAKVEIVDKLKPILDTFDEKTETFVTYHVHIVRENDNVESICAKYNVSKEELSNYNEIKEIKLGDKLIVPAYNSEKN